MFPVLGTLHLGIAPILRLAGYRFEIRRSGEAKLGLWRKRMRSGKKAHPKRFVLVPGFGDTPISWLPVLTVLLPILRLKYDEVILVDFPGFKGFLHKERSFQSMDSLIHALSDAFDSLRPHTVIGHSFGGWLSSHYAGKCGVGERPARNTLGYKGPEKVILLNPSGAFGDERVKQEWAQFFEDVVKEGFSKLRPRLFFKEPIWFRLIAREMSDLIFKEDIVAFLKSVKEEHVVEALLPETKSKVWVIWGEKDGLIPLACAQAWDHGLLSIREGKSRTLLLKGIGHSAHLENPALVAFVIGQVLVERAHWMLEHRLAKRWWKPLITDS